MPEILNGSETDAIESMVASISDRIAAFVMLDGMGTATLAEKSVRLSLCGFRRADIAVMLGITPASVSQNLYSERKKAEEGSKARRTKQPRSRTKA